MLRAGLPVFLTALAAVSAAPAAADGSLACNARHGLCVVTAENASSGGASRSEGGSARGGRSAVVSACQQWAAEADDELRGCLSAPGVAEPAPPVHGRATRTVVTLDPFGQHQPPALLARP